MVGCLGAPSPATDAPARADRCPASHPIAPIWSVYDNAQMRRARQPACQSRLLPSFLRYSRAAWSEEMVLGIEHRSALGIRSPRDERTVGVDDGQRRDGGGREFMSLRGRRRLRDGLVGRERKCAEGRDKVGDSRRRRHGLRRRTVDVLRVNA